MKDKNYFNGVKKVRQHPSGVITISGRAEQMSEWISENQTHDGWINIDIKSKGEDTKHGTHVAYLSPYQK